MTTLEYKLLGLLARQPMSGYDLASRLKKRFVPFGPISHTQIYPALASLEQQGLVRYHIVEQQAVRPNKKVYELTAEGRAALRQWVESPTPLVFSYDEFFLKAYSLWLADPERIVERFREQAQLHQERAPRKSKSDMECSVSRFSLMFHPVHQFIAPNCSLHVSPKDIIVA